MKKVQTITNLIGHTPLVAVKNTGDTSGTVYAKLEYFNPGGSVKDRIALAMVEKAEQEGLLKAGGTIVEPTSGNTGIGLAMVGAAKGYKVIIVMPDTMSKERQLLMKGYGAKLILTPGAEGMKGAIAKATELSQQDGYFMPLQFANAANPNVHEKTTGPEIIDAFAGEKIDAFVAGVGTGGTVTGVARALKAVYPDVKIYAVEPSESEVLRGGTHHPHKIQGIGAGFVPDVLDQDLIDEVLPVSSEEALKMARSIAQTDGILAGISGGAALVAAKQLADKMGAKSNIVTVIPDNGERYLSVGIYDA
ncbi:cysteine synthase A [Vagococcus penaei]|uniref:Cysteine synthase n=1 Tax=Vagococcus penaei TaxID=633807 RepID=A0A1Q2D4C6_9ENTE|nr:cysteine synthase A [Vagococcus penaei]AQP53125.1 cysteine synthase A [Vagococcus penaei]RSU06013.1 cysteine synthase A [Vagococcus penaei]